MARFWIVSSNIHKQNEEQSTSFSDSRNTVNIATLKPQCSMKLHTKINTISISIFKIVTPIEASSRFCSFHPNGIIRIGFFGGMLLPSESSKSIVLYFILSFSSRKFSLNRKDLVYQCDSTFLFMNPDAHASFETVHNEYSSTTKQFTFYELHYWMTLYSSIVNIYWTSCFRQCPRCICASPAKENIFC